jgi:hypothetical protein
MKGKIPAKKVEQKEESKEDDLEARLAALKM